MTAVTVLKGQDYAVTEDPGGGYLLDLGLEGGPESHMDMVSVGQRLAELGIRNDLARPLRRPIPRAWWWLIKAAIWANYWAATIASVVLRWAADVLYNFSIWVGQLDIKLEQRFYKDVTSDLFTLRHKPDTIVSGGAERPPRKGRSGSNGTHVLRPSPRLRARRRPPRRH